MFDAKSFMRTKFAPREQEVPVPALAPFFGEAPAVFRVRGLAGDEWARVNEAAETAKKLSAITEKLLGGGHKEQADALAELLGVSGDTPPEISRRLTVLTMGAVEPAIDRPTAVRIKDNYPAEFYELTNVVLRLTGEGRQPGKPPGSGETPKSEPPSVSVTSGDASSTSADPTSSPADS